MLSYANELANKRQQRQEWYDEWERCRIEGASHYHLRAVAREIDRLQAAIDSLELDKTTR